MSASVRAIVANGLPRGQRWLSFRRRSDVLGLVLITPALVLVCGLVLYPVAYDIALALSDAEGFSGPGHFVGLANFVSLLQDAEFWRAARNSLVYTVVTTALRLVLGLGMALAIWRMRRGREVVFIALFIAWVFPATLSAFAFYWLLSPPFHTFYTLPLLELRWLLADRLGDDVWKVLTVALHDVWRSSAFVAIFLLAGLNTFSSDQLDYARLECGSAWRRLRLVVLPMLRKFLVLAALLSLVMSFLDYTGIYLETGGRITWPLFGTLAYQQSFLIGRTAFGSAVTLIQLPVWLLVLWLAFRWFERDARPASPRETDFAFRSEASGGKNRVREDEKPGQANRRMLAHFGLPAAGTAIVVFAIFPIWWIFLQAVRPASEDRFGNPFWTWSPTFNGFIAAISGRLVGTWLLNTLIVLALGVTLTLLAGGLAGYALGRLRVPGRRWFARLLFACYFLPYPMLLVPVYQVFLWLHLDNSLLAVVLLNQTLTIPFATWLCFSYFEGLPADVEEHASLDGSAWAVLRHIVLPMSWPVLIAIAIFCAGIMASDVIYAGLFLIHDDVKTIAVGLGLIGISLDEFDTISGGIGMAAAPLVILCAAFAPAYVRGLSAAMIEGA